MQSRWGEVWHLLQAADESSPPMPRELAAKLMNKVNPADAGGMHGMLPVHIGVRVRLLDHVDLEKGLVKDAEGVVAHIAIHPSDEEEVSQARQLRRAAYLKHAPYGISQGDSVTTMTRRQATSHNHLQDGV